MAVLYLSCALEDATILPYDGKLHLDVLTFFQETLSTKTNHRYWSHTQQHRVSEITTCNSLMFQWSSVAVWDDRLRELTHDSLRELSNDTVTWQSQRTGNFMVILCLSSMYLLFLLTSFGNLGLPPTATTKFFALNVLYMKRSQNACRYFRQN